MSRHPPQRKTKRLQTERFIAAYPARILERKLLETGRPVPSPDPTPSETPAAGPAEIRRLLAARALAARRHRVAVGRRLGLGDTEISAVSLLASHGALTASELARLLLLTSGGVSALVSRLEQAGCVSRRPHATDGRSVVLVLTASFVERATPQFAPLTAALDAVIAALEPEEEAIVTRFLDEVATLVEEDAERLATRDERFAEPQSAAVSTAALWA